MCKHGRFCFQLGCANSGPGHRVTHAAFVPLCRIAAGGAEARDLASCWVGARRQLACPQCWLRRADRNGPSARGLSGSQGRGRGGRIWGELPPFAAWFQADKAVFGPVPFSRQAALPSLLAARLRHSPNTSGLGPLQREPRRSESCPCGMEGDGLLTPSTPLKHPPGDRPPRPPDRTRLRRLKCNVPACHKVEA